MEFDRMIRKDVDREHRPNVENSRPQWTVALRGRQSLGHSLVRESSMTLIWLGVLLVFGGMILLIYQPIWRGRLSGRRRLRSRPIDTLEPERPASGFGLKPNWPGLALVALGAALLLAGVAI
jgi:hypothetical protein